MCQVLVRPWGASCLPVSQVALSPHMIPLQEVSFVPKAVLQHFNSDVVNVLVNNAAIADPSMPLAPEAAIARFQEVLDVNLFGNLHFLL